MLSFKNPLKNLFFSNLKFIKKNLFEKQKIGANRLYSSEANNFDQEDLMKSYTNGKTSYTTTVSKFHLIPDTIQEIIDNKAAQLNEKIVYHFPHQKMNMSFRELKQRVDTTAQNLLGLGFKKGDRLAFALPNSYELVTTFLAAAQIGVISTILNPACQLVEFEYMLKKAGAKGIIIYDTFKILNHIDILQKLCPELNSCLPGELNSKILPELKHVFVLNSPLMQEKKLYKGTWSFNEELSQSKSEIIKNEIPYVSIEDPCLILFTSGTTGKPKGAVMSQTNLLTSAYLSTICVGKPEGLSMVCNPVPFFHIFGLSTGVLIPLLMGSTKVFPFYFPDTLTTMKAIEHYKCVTMRGVPTQYVDILNHPEMKKHNLSSLKNIVVGGSTVDPALLSLLRKELKIESFIVGYGMTETSLCHSMTTFLDEKLSFKRSFESVGRPIPFTETKIVDPITGRIQPINTDGELYLKGPHIIKKYWDEPEKTSETFDENGWLKTGDIFSMDEEGYLYFKSRSKDLIIRGGANLYPAEIENYLKTHPKIADVQVFGVPDERTGEEVCCWIKLKPKNTMIENDVKSFCKGNISHFKIPRYIKFVENFPMNASGKALKNAMREIAKKDYNLK